MVRGGHIEGLSCASLRNILGIGDDDTVFTYMQNPPEVSPAPR